MKHYLFIENNSGEMFIVGAENYDVAWNIAESVWENEPESDLEYCYEMSDFEAEASGLDEY